MKLLSIINSYKAMYFFLKGYCYEYPSDDLGSRMGDLMFAENENDVSTMDPAAWYDWLDSIYRTFPQKNQTVSGELTYHEAFKVMCSFLSEYQKNTNSEKIKKILNEFVTNVLDADEIKYEKTVIWKTWQESIQKGIHAKSSAD